MDTHTHACVHTSIHTQHKLMLWRQRGAADGNVKDLLFEIFNVI